MNKVVFIVLMLGLLLLAGRWASHAGKAEQFNAVTQSEFTALSRQPDTVIIDVRSSREYAHGHIPGAINIPHSEIVSEKTNLDQYQGKTIVLYCHTGIRASVVNEYLEKNSKLDTGDIYLLKGNFRAWQARGKSIEKL